MAAVRDVEYSPIDSQSVCPSHVRNCNEAQEIYRLKNGAENRAIGRKAPPNSAQASLLIELALATPGSRRQHQDHADSEYGGTEGKLAPAGAVVVFGNYNIQVENKHGKPDPREGTIVIHYESGNPITADADGVMHFVCALSHPEWGLGRARGVVEGKTIRNILTFPPELP